MQVIDCQLLQLQTSDTFVAGPAIGNSIDNSTCAVSYTSRAQLVSGTLMYDGISSLPNGSIHLSVLDSLENLDPGCSFVIPELQPYSLAGSRVSH